METKKLQDILIRYIKAVIFTIYPKEVWPTENIYRVKKRKVDKCNINMK